MPQQAQSADIRYSRKTTLNYLVFLPIGYDARGDQRWPLILALHGAGERGSDLELLKTQGLPKRLETWPDCPFIIVAPQCEAESYWVFKLDALDTFLTCMIEKYAVDENRIYLTGFSMGGHGTWHLAIAAPMRFAAIAPICGRGIRSMVGLIKHIPAWVFHGARDAVIPLS